MATTSKSNEIAIKEIAIKEIAIKEIAIKEIAIKEIASKEGSSLALKSQRAKLKKATTSKEGSSLSAEGPLIECFLKLGSGGDQSGDGRTSRCLHSLALKSQRAKLGRARGGALEEPRGDATKMQLAVFARNFTHSSSCLLRVVGEDADCAAAPATRNLGSVQPARFAHVAHASHEVICGV
eukprot:CAMPEP_0179848404 /NCGR_PEP_ID=MMETSP0982-20121206/6603_1 /TAXON_ID=483367 /ORGANISM="non described non described, Strain CCMP 2436" /LENGTH=180 /DNA_ID=CAMNT_0021733663 /DNA_START=311 /DNA_END=855 /DNA_ORIENTATION=-